ncbi:Cthe_2314 family HEPN domain-containing protein [Bernardetia sp. ABR2-2B]|uniref:Cthe_2314 family HEPN domain-containing protein n=1 Tax=Bernardetia sp. ABR2-2B TaxID=3127472 RepID=UPI0030D3DF62
MRIIEKHEDNSMLILAFGELKSYLDKAKKLEKRPPISQKEKYLIDIALSANNITECLDQVYFSTELLSGYKQRKKSIMTRYDYIVFMVENFYLRLTSTFDRVLRLTNLVFDIGLPERECKQSTIIQNSKIKTTPVATNLKKIEKIINSYRKTRNQIAHSETYDGQTLGEENLFDIRAFYLVRHEFKNDNKMQILMKLEIDNYVKDKKVELNEITRKLEKAVIELFESLTPFIEKK